MNVTACHCERGAAIQFRGFVAVCLLLTIVSTATAKYSGGSGTADDPYQIATAADLMSLGDHDRHFVLTADIDLDPNLPGRMVFKGAVIYTFTGVFDGNGHRIWHLTAKGSGGPGGLGLFGTLASGGEVKNLGVVDVNIAGSHDDDRIGGLVGYNEGSVNHCYSTGTVVGGESVGGLVGHNDGGSVSDSYSASSTVGGECAVGGLVGLNSAGVVTQCYSAGTVGGGSGVGGLVGYNGGSVNHCYSTGTVSGGSSVGGLLGSNGGPVTCCYSTGMVAGQGEVGGLVGWNVGSLTHCYSTGAVSGTDDVGGLVGTDRLDECTKLPCSGGLATNCFWDSQTSGQATSDGGTDKTTAEMQTAATFLDAGWDFADETGNGIWWIREGDDYPRLAWRALSPGPYDGATDVIGSPLLSWHRTITATEHDVYFGDDADVVANATTASQGIYRGRRPAEATTYACAALEWAKTYYWRIDEVNPDEPGSPWKGTVWSFSTSDLPIVSVIDDFENYTDDMKAGQAIFQTWHDKWGYTGDPNDPDDQPSFAGNGTGALVGYAYQPFTERTIVHSGRQSMPMDYNNVREPWYSEAQRMWETPQDWTIEGADTLTLYFRGNPVSFMENAGVVTMSGSGAGSIYRGGFDDCRFAYKRLNGNGSIVVKIESIGDANTPTAQAGVMIRKGLDPGSQSAYLACTPDHRIVLGSRDGGWAGDAYGVQTPQWVKLTRKGDAFTAQHSSDGQTWTDVTTWYGVPGSSVYAPMTPAVYIGLWVASGDAELTATAVFSDIATTGDVTGEWQVASIGYRPQILNAPQNLYVRIEDNNGKSASVVHPDVEAILATEWQKWHIDLGEVRAAGVDVAAVKKMVIGVGDRQNPKPGGTGRIYIDDIRLTQRMP